MEVFHHLIHGSLELWGMFILGMLVSMLKRATFAIRSGRYKTRKEFFQSNWDAFLIRAVLGGIVFWMWYDNKVLLSKGLSYLGVAITWEIPVTHATSLLFGYFVDAMLDWVTHRIPWLRGQIPDVVGGVIVTQDSPTQATVKVPATDGKPATEVTIKAPGPDEKEKP